MATNRGVAIQGVVRAEGDLDFRGTMGVDRDVPVGYQRIVCEIRVTAQGDPARIQRMVEKAEQYCVVRDTLARGVPVESRVTVDSAAPVPGG